MELSVFEEPLDSGVSTDPDWSAEFSTELIGSVLLYLIFSCLDHKDLSKGFFYPIFGLKG